MSLLPELLVFAALPAAALGGFAVLTRRLRAAGYAGRLELCWFALFLAYGNLVGALLSSLFLPGNPVTGIGMLLLLVISFVLTPAVAFVLWRDQQRSAFHRVACFMALAWWPAAAASLWAMRLV